MMLTLLLFHSSGATADEMEVFLLISSGSKSVTVLPSVTFPNLSVAFEKYKSASASDVFPLDA